MNKRGFTLVELLAVIVIIALIGGIAVVSYTSFINSTTTKAFEKYQDTMHAEAIQYIANNYGSLTFTSNKLEIKLANLPIETISNPKNKNDTCINNNSYVEVTRSYSSEGVLSMSYKVCLKCPNSGFNNCKTYDN